MTQDQITAACDKMRTIVNKPVKVEVTFRMAPRDGFDASVVCVWTGHVIDVAAVTEPLPLPVLRFRIGRDVKAVNFPSTDLQYSGVKFILDTAASVPKSSILGRTQRDALEDDDDFDRVATVRLTENITGKRQAKCVQVGSRCVVDNVESDIAFMYPQHWVSIAREQGAAVAYDAWTRNVEEWMTANSVIPKKRAAEQDIAATKKLVRTWLFLDPPSPDSKVWDVGSLIVEWILRSASLIARGPQGLEIFRVQTQAAKDKTILDWSAVWTEVLKSKREEIVVAGAGHWPGQIDAPIQGNFHRQQGNFLRPVIAEHSGRGRGYYRNQR